MKKDNKERLENLAEKLLDAFHDRLDNGDEVYDSKNEQHVRTKASPSTLRVIKDFLKDNSVGVPENNNEFASLLGKLEDANKALNDADDDYTLN